MRHEDIPEINNPKIRFPVLEGDKLMKEVLNGGYNVHPVPARGLDTMLKEKLSRNNRKNNYYRSSVYWKCVEEKREENNRKEKTMNVKISKRLRIGGYEPKAQERLTAANNRGALEITRLVSPGLPLRIIF